VHFLATEFARLDGSIAKHGEVQKLGQPRERPATAGQFVMLVTSSYYWFVSLMPRFEKCDCRQRQLVTFSYCLWLPVSFAIRNRCNYCTDDQQPRRRAQWHHAVTFWRKKKNFFYCECLKSLSDRLLFLIDSGTLFHAAAGATSTKKTGGQTKFMTARWGACLLLIRSDTNRLAIKL